MTVRLAEPAPAPSWPASQLRENSRPAQGWIQESITGSRFAATYRAADRGIIASITGRAFVTAEARLIRQPEDPFADGLADIASARPTQPITVGDFAGRRTRFGSGLAQ